MAMDIAAVNKLLSQPNALVRNFDALVESISTFLSQYDDIACNFGNHSSADDIKPLLTSLRENMPAKLEILVARMIKMLLRKQINRNSINKQGILAVVCALQRQVANRTIAAAEIANVVLNTCYDGANVVSFLEEGGMPLLLRLLETRDENVQASVLGAIQGVCFVPLGRQAVRSNDMTIPFLCNFLSSENGLVRARAIGTVHNISADTVSIFPLRSASVITALISLLGDRSAEVVLLTIVASITHSNKETLILSVVKLKV